MLTLSVQQCSLLVTDKSHWNSLSSEKNLIQISTSAHEIDNNQTAEDAK